MSLRSSVLSALPLVFLAVQAPAVERPQQVVISFDGAGPLAQWERSRALARETGARFTYFLSCVYLLPQEKRLLYKAPRHTAGKSNVGFATSREEVVERLREIWAARGEGHEIASHACGHFDGGDWSAAEWRDELTEFTRVLRDAWRINELEGEPEGWRSFAETEVTGFRAPYLSTGAQLDAALAKAGFRYDASRVSRGPQAPTSGKINMFALPMIPEGPQGKPVIAMDYNLYVRHSGGFERPSEAATFEQRSYDAFMAAFRAQYDGDRTPLQLGFHFTLMNDGAYWNALERFAREVCVMEDVRCVSYRGLLADAAGDDARHALRGGHD
ncbi:MAG: polysaccharide deacetylase [Rhizobiaceae bacterium]|nr:polysaccharide deacetylase [Rhizobiaceae bacterium]